MDSSSKLNVRRSSRAASRAWIARALRLRVVWEGWKGAEGFWMKVVLWRMYAGGLEVILVLNGESIGLGVWKGLVDLLKCYRRLLGASAPVGPAP